MADVTVTYKGTTISEISASGTKTLKTGGKFCEDDITLQYVKPSGTWNWMGKNPTLVSNYSPFTVALKDTDFASWTPSTTPKVILASADWGTFEADMANYDYIVKWTFETNLVYLQTATLKVTPQKQASIYCQSINRRSSNYTNFMSKTLNQNYYYPTFAAILAMQGTIYYNASGTISFAYHQGSYGFYQGMATPGFSNSTVDNPTVTLKRPTLNARCDTTYMATERAAEIDKINSTLTIKCEVYRVDKPASAEIISLDLADLFE